MTVRRRGPVGRRPSLVRPLVVEVLQPDKVLSQFHAMNAPARPVEGQQLDGSQRALARSQTHGVGDVRTARGGGTGQRTDTQQIANVGYYPVVARLNEQVVIQRLDGFLDRAEGDFRRRQEGLQLARRTLLL